MEPQVDLALINLKNAVRHLLQCVDEDWDRQTLLAIADRVAGAMALVESSPHVQVEFYQQLLQMKEEKPKADLIEVSRRIGSSRGLTVRWKDSTKKWEIFRHGMFLSAHASPGVVLDKMKKYAA